MLVCILDGAGQFVVSFIKNLGSDEQTHLNFASHFNSRNRESILTLRSASTSLNIFSSSELAGFCPRHSIATLNLFGDDAIKSSPGTIHCGLPQYTIFPISFPAQILLIDFVGERLANKIDCSVAQPDKLVAQCFLNKALTLNVCLRGRNFREILKDRS